MRITSDEEAIIVNALRCAADEYQRHADELRGRAPGLVEVFLMQTRNARALADKIDTLGLAE